ncbi:MAG: DUF86 domain-containing protein [Chitinophagaceae bacterium]|nr:DUF86 domain-containing protein [Chitinophagaceae bacterium]
MSERETSLLLADIQEAIGAILHYTTNYTFEDYLNNLKTRHAVERNFEIIGEAANRLPENFKEAHPQIDWRILKDFRNFLIHDYFGINQEIVWQTIITNLPGLLSDIKTIL